MTSISEIQAKLSVISSEVIKINDVSAPHKGHAEYSEFSQVSHIHILIVSNEFNNMTNLARHRLIMSLLKPEFQNGLHAASIDAFTPSEYAATLKNQKF
ncbi:bolA-like family protein [Orientia chuto str. Dubai]|uniref:BolA-like family protein n=1 Tax=Orientia chuto str. Dubai TaxID=1359168 RepID=A0A0F3MMB5_9RICK|nr:BolA family protein [Candidatus Orientia mediorientalis]KJV55729.1 bolA-like family protein [Orientia chuto str. Dubai]